MPIRRLTETSPLCVRGPIRRYVPLRKIEAPCSDGGFHGYRAARTDEGRDFKAVFLCDGKVAVAIVVVGRRFSQTLLQVRVEPDLEKKAAGVSFSAWVMPLPERMICTSPALSGSHCRLLLS